MPLLGTLSTMPLPDLLQWLGTARLTGTLQLERNRVSKWILIKEGLVVGCSSDDPPERLGQFLLSRGKITEDQLRIALTVQESSPKHLGKIFIEMGALTMDDLTSHLEAKAEETIFSLFDWEDAQFRFHADISDLANILPLGLRIEDILLRGLKRFDEMKIIRDVFNDPGIVLRHTDKQPRERMLKNRIAKTIYESIDGERSVAGILLHVHGSEYLVTKFLYDLHRNGYVTISHVKQLPKPEPARAPEEEPSRPTAETTELPSGDDGGIPQLGPVEIDLPAGASGADGPADAARAPEHETAVATLEAEVADEPTAPVTERGVEPIEDSDAYQLDQQLQRARRLLQAADYEDALEILDRAYDDHPDDEHLRRITLEAEAAFLEKAYRHYVPGDKIPVLSRPVEELETETLSPSEFFLLSRIDGTWDVKSIIKVAPLREVEAVLTLKRMREGGLIDLRDPEDG